MKYLIIFLLLASSVFAVTGYISTIYDLYQIGDDATSRDGDYVLLNDIDLAYTAGTGVSAWAAASDYVVGDIASSDGDYYYSVVAYNGTDKGEWTNSTAYVVGDIVDDGVGVLFRCTVSHESNAEGALTDDSDNWTYAEPYVNLANDPTPDWVIVGNVTTGWRGWGEDEGFFTGTFDGGGHTISNLTQTNPRGVSGQNNNSGLAGYTVGCTIQNLILTDIVIADATIEAGHNVGGLAARANTTACTISNVHVIGGTLDSGSGNHTVALGGLVGSVGDSTVITQCSVQDLTITGVGTGKFGGCVIGNITAATGYTITYNYASGCKITMPNVAGGFVGVANAASMSNCYAINTDTSETKINGATYTSGFAGLSIGTPTYLNCYCVGKLLATGTEAPFLQDFGGGNATVTSCYYDTTVDAIAESGKGTPKTTAEMKQRTTFVDWDFARVWELNQGENSGYPYLWIRNGIYNRSRYGMSEGYRHRYN